MLCSKNRGVEIYKCRYLVFVGRYGKHIYILYRIVKMYITVYCIYYSFSFLFLYTDTVYCFYKLAGATVQNRYFRAIQLDQYIINFHTHQGGKYMFYSMDPCTVVLDGRTARCGYYVVHICFYYGFIR